MYNIQYFTVMAFTSDTSKYTVGQVDFTMNDINIIILICRYRSTPRCEFYLYSNIIIIIARACARRRGCCRSIVVTTHHRRRRRSRRLPFENSSKVIIVVVVVVVVVRRDRAERPHRLRHAKPAATPSAATAVSCALN